MSNAGVAEILAYIRQHHAMQDFLSAVEAPAIKPFKKVDADKIEVSRAGWIYESGQLAQHERWLAFLTGNTEVK